MSFLKRWIASAGLALLARPATAFAQDTLVDPAGSGVLVCAVGWLQGTLLGTIAFATDAIASNIASFKISSLVNSVREVLLAMVRMPKLMVPHKRL